LKVKNALVKDDSNAAAAAKFYNFNAANTTWCEIEKEYIDIADDAKEHAEHIVDNLEIAHQREDFALLSRDMKDIKTFGTKKIISRLLSNVRSR
jgi:hypothetical protein